MHECLGPFGFQLKGKGKGKGKGIKTNLPTRDVKCVTLLAFSECNWVWGKKSGHLIVITCSAL